MKERQGRTDMRAFREKKGQHYKMMKIKRVPPRRFACGSGRLFSSLCSSRPMACSEGFLPLRSEWDFPEIRCVKKSRVFMRGLMPPTFIDVVVCSKHFLLASPYLTDWEEGICMLFSIFITPVFDIGGSMLFWKKSVRGLSVRYLKLASSRRR